MIRHLQYTINHESIEFLFNHDLLPKTNYDNIIELQYDIDELRSFNSFNVSYSKENNEPSYDSMFFAVVEYHIDNVIKFNT